MFVYCICTIEVSVSNMMLRYDLITLSIQLSTVCPWHCRKLSAIMACVLYCICLWLCVQSQLMASKVKHGDQVPCRKNATVHQYLYLGMTDIVKVLQIFRGLYVTWVVIQILALSRSLVSFQSKYTGIFICVFVSHLWVDRCLKMLAESNWICTIQL